MFYLGWAALWFCAAGALAALFDRRLEECLAPAACSAILLLYLFGLAGPLLPGVLVAAGCCAAGAGLLVWRFVKGDAAAKKQLLGRIFTPGAVLAGVMVLYFFVMLSGRVVLGNDEFSHWAFTVKQMVHWDALSLRHADEMIFPEYPPAAALWQYLFIRLVPGFVESYLYRAMSLLLLSLLLPFLANYSWKRFGGAAAALLAVFLLPLTFYSNLYYDLCVDGLLGLLFAWLLYLWYGGGRRLDGFVLFGLCTGCAVLVLTKASGLLFALAALSIIVWDAAAQKQPLRPLLWPLAALAAAKLSWSVLCAIYIGGGGSGNLLHNLASLAGPWPERYIITLGGFMRTLFEQVDVPLHLSSATRFVGALCLLWAAFRKEPDGGGRLRLALGLGFVGYCLGLLYLYFFHFSEYEGTRVASETRYLGSWLLGMAMLGLLLLLGQWGRAGRSELNLPLLALCGSMMVAQFSVSFISPYSEAAPRRASRSAYLSPESVSFAPTDRVYFVAADTTNYELLAATYSLYPIRCDASLGHNFHAQGEFSLWANEVSAEAWAAELAANYTYVYLYGVDTTFYDAYGALFGGAENIVARILYRVEPQPGGGVLLVRAWP